MGKARGDLAEPRVERKKLDLGEIDDVGAKRTLEWALEVIAHAWAQLLAGDIEDLIQDLADNGLWPADVPTG